MTLPAESPMTARALRARTRDDEAQGSRLLLLQDVADRLARERSIADGLVHALARVTRHLQIDAALVLQPNGGALTVFCGVGAVLPVGASLPAGGVLAEVQRSPAQAVLREHVVSRLRLAGAAVAGYEWLLPLSLATRCVGVLALIGEPAARLPDREDQSAIAAVAVLMAGALAIHQTPKPRRANPQAAATLNRLTAREQQVLGLLPSGASNADIAARLGIAPGTAKVHIERILHKLGVRDRTAAAVIAADCGLRA